MDSMSASQPPPPVCPYPPSHQCQGGDQLRGLSHLEKIPPFPGRCLQAYCLLLPWQPCFLWSPQEGGLAPRPLPRPVPGKSWAASCQLWPEKSPEVWGGCLGGGNPEKDFTHNLWLVYHSAYLPTRAAIFSSQEIGCNSQRSPGPTLRLAT